jgi:acetolactate synthase-1/2/3 large subunit
MVNIVGEHSTSHLKYDPPLRSDIEGIARPLSDWVRRADSASAIAWDAAKAVAKASEHPGQIATLILPGDTSWQEAGTPLVPSREPVARKAPDAARVEHVAQVLRSGEPTLIILANKATRGVALERAGQVAAATGARLGSQFFTARIERGAGRVPIERIPYAVAQGAAFLRPFKHIVTVETGEPVAFFSYPDKPSLLKAEGTLVHPLVEADEDSALAFEMLLDALEASKVAPILQQRVQTAVPSGALNPLSVAHALAAALPENCILVDESLTTGRESMGHTLGALPHDLINNMGGSIGYATPVATGAALACPDRRVFCMVGDGSAMYTIQSLWTQARENLNITTIIFANNSYAILRTEYANMGAGVPGPRALSMIDIDRPRIDWLAMAKSMGVGAAAVNTAESFHKAMVDSAREPGPSLIEVRL